MPLKKIVIIGPESTGKSTLCENLAAHFHTGWVREYAREYLIEHGMGYQYETLSVIARGQLALEDAAVENAATEKAAADDAAAEPAQRAIPLADAGAKRAHDLLFIDTDMYVMKVWSEHVFGRCEPWILDEIVRRKYDGYLLCNTDLPWAPDPLREYPDPGIRERLFHIYKDLLVNQTVPWAEVGGTGDARLSQAIESVRRMLQ